MRKAGNNGFEAYRQRLVYDTSDKEGSTGLFVQIVTYKFGSRMEDVEGQRRYDEATGTDPYPDQVRKACIISNTLEPLKRHLQLNVGQQGNFDALRVATGDYSRSRRIFKTTSNANTHGDEPMEIDALSPEGKGKGKFRQGQERWQERQRKPHR